MKMKRSEMVKRLSDEFCDLSVFDDDHKWSDNIIKFLEENGMSPPCIFKNGDYLLEWEPENE